MNINSALDRFEELRKSLKLRGRKLATGRNYQLDGKTIISVYSSGTDQPGSIEVAFAVENIAPLSNRSSNDTRAWITHLQNSIGTYAKPKTAYQYPRVSLSSNAQTDNAITEIINFIASSLPAPQEISTPPHTPHSSPTFIDKRILAQIQTRRGQAQFRENLLRAYTGQCAVTGCAAKAALEAAHIFPFSQGQSYKTRHGILLRADIHTLFDLKLISVNPQNLSIVIAPELLVSYKDLQGTKIRIPDDLSESPDLELLTSHYCYWKSKYGS